MRKGPPFSEWRGSSNRKPVLAQFSGSMPSWIFEQRIVFFEQRISKIYHSRKSVSNGNCSLNLHIYAMISSSSSGRKAGIGQSASATRAVMKCSTPRAHMKSISKNCMTITALLSSSCLHDIVVVVAVTSLGVIIIVCFGGVCSGRQDIVSHVAGGLSGLSWQVNV